MKLEDILRDKGAAVHAIAPSETLRRVVDLLVEHNCGALVVLDGDRMAGIISERDVLKACAELDEPLAARVQERMSTGLVTAAPHDDLEHVMGLMTQHRIRHLPVIDDGVLAGVISIGDIVKAQHADLTSENRLLKQYIRS